MFKVFSKGFRCSFLLLIFASIYAPSAFAQILIDNLTGGSSSHQSTIHSAWSKHEWDIIFPVEYRGQQISNPVVYYRLNGDTAVTVNGGFTSGDDGSFIVTPQNASLAISVTPPGTDQTDHYLIFEFTDQTLDVPGDGIVWFRFDWVSGDNHRMDIGALGTYTTTYEQNESVRSGGTSFAVLSDDIETTSPVPALSPWALAALALLLGLFAVRRQIRTA